MSGYKLGKLSQQLSSVKEAFGTIDEPPFLTSATWSGGLILMKIPLPRSIRLSGVIMLSAKSFAHLVFAPMGFHYLVNTPLSIIVVISKTLVLPMAYVHPSLSQDTSLLSKDPGVVQVGTRLLARCW